MNWLVRFFFIPSRGPTSIFLIRLAVGLIFFTQGILKFTDPHMGVIRFARIGFPHPYFTAHFVGTFEILCGFLLLIGLYTRAASVPLLIVICTAIGSTRIPELFRANQGCWYMVSDARDFAMLCSLMFLILMARADGRRTHPVARNRNAPRSRRNLPIDLGLEGVRPNSPLTSAVCSRIDIEVRYRISSMQCKSVHGP
jgi:putative oxidoreductase